MAHLKVWRDDPMSPMTDQQVSPSKAMTQFVIFQHKQNQKMSSSGANRDLNYVVIGLEPTHHIHNVYHIITVQSSIAVLLLKEDKVHSFLL